MKNNIMRIILVLCLCTVVFAVWNKDKPSSSTSLRSSNPEILANWSALETAITQDHEFSTGGTNSGEHKQIKFNAPISTPTNAANKSFVYEKDVSAVVELHWLDESGNELQMTSGGDLFSSTGLTVTSASTFNGSITLGAGDDLIGSSTSDITFNTNKFTVAGATGNTVIAGTLTQQGVATLADTSALATSGAPAADAQIANKKYVDDNIGSANWTPTSYANEESVTFPNGLIMKQGSESASTSVVVSFAVAFPNAIKTIQLTTVSTIGDFDDFQVDSGSVSTSGFTAQVAGTTNLASFYWTVIGY